MDYYWIVVLFMTTIICQSSGNTQVRTSRQNGGILSRSSSSRYNQRSYTTHTRRTSHISYSRSRLEYLEHGWVGDLFQSVSYGGPGPTNRSPENIGLQEIRGDIGAFAEVIETLQNCSRPAAVDGVLQFINVGDRWVELNDTDQESFEYGTTVSYQCQNPGLKVLEGIGDIKCLSGGWTEEPPYCIGVQEQFFIEPAKLPRKVQHDGSITVYLPPMTSDRNVEVTCRMRQTQPSLRCDHIVLEEGRAEMMSKRGDSIYFKAYLTLTPARKNDSCSFTCQDQQYGSSPHRLSINFEDMLVESCPENQTSVTDQGVNDTEFHWDPPMIHADLTAEITSNFNSGDRFPIGVSVVTISATVESGTFEICTFHVHVIDSELPRIEGCPTGIRETTEPSQNFSLVTWEEPIAIDNSGNAVLTKMVSQGNGSAFPIGDTSVTYEARDAHGNVNICNFTITVIDTEAPVVECPASQRLVLELDAGTAVIDLPEPNATDNSGHVDLEQSGAERGRNYPHGNYTINYTARDRAENTDQCFFQVFVVDEQPPDIIGCPKKQRKWLNPSLEESVSVAWIEPTVTDNTGYVDVSSSHQPGQMFSPGRHDIYVIAIDSSQNEEVCHFKVIVYEGKCERIINMSLMWDEANPGVHIPSRQVCPLNTTNAGTPLAYRNCTFYSILGARWSAQALPTNCGLPRNNVTLQDIKYYPIDQFTAEDVAATLSEVVTNMNETLRDPSDVILISDIIDEIVETKVPSPNILKSILETMEMVYLAENSISISEEHSDISTRITAALERQVSILSNSGMKLTIETTNIVVRTLTVEDAGTSPGKTTYEIQPRDRTRPQSGPSMPGSDVSVPAVKLPLQEINRTIAKNGTVAEDLHLAFIYYENPVLFVRAEKAAQSRDPSLQGEITGGIVSASVGDWTISDLRESVEIRFPMRAVENLTRVSVQCVFWDYTLSANGGGWSREGCWLGEQTHEYIICHSDHLTHFAVLMDFSGGGEQSPVLDILTKIGCTLSIIGLSITIITFITFRTLRNSRHRQILINHCLSLLLLYVVFLAGIDSNIGFVCIASAILLHYLMLTTMFWMAVEAHNMYMYLVKVFQRDIRRFILKGSILAWGFPLIITIASVLSSYENYKNEHHCYPNPGLNLYLSLLLPICLVMVHNFVIFSMVVCRLVFTDVAGKAVTQSRKQQIITRLQNAVCMSVLMGLSWSFGFLVVAHPTFIFQLLFCIVNSLQGVAVFILFCVRVSDVRAAYKTCMPWLDVELNIRGQSYKVQERSVYHNRFGYLNGEDPLWSCNSNKVVNALSWPSDTPGLEGYMHLQFEGQLSTNTDTTRVSSNSFSFQRSNSKFSKS